jgi:hypothetical protein
MRDRVQRYRKGPETPPTPSNDDDDNSPASPPTTPPWQPSEEERRVIWPEKSKVSVDKTFEIDTTKSFLDAPKPAGLSSQIVGLKLKETLAERKRSLKGIEDCLSQSIYYSS